MTSFCPFPASLSLSDPFSDTFSLPQELKRHNAQAVVRVCEPSYKTDLLEKEGITVTDLVYDDGTYPPAQARPLTADALIQ